MGFRLRVRLLEPKRVSKVLLTLVLLLLFFGHRHHRSRAPHRISSPSAASELALAILANKRLTSTDASQPQFAQALCQEHGWDVFRKKMVPKPGTAASKRKVYDLFTVNTELDWLEIRLNATYEFVDYFVIVEGPKTFTGLDKPLHVRDNWARLAPYHDKIIHHELQYPPGFNPHLAWDYEDLQRNALLTQVFPTLTGARAPTEGDVLVVGDVDEIVRPEALLVLRACEFPRRLTLRSRFFYYGFQLQHRGAEWAHPQATTYRGPRDTILPDDLRKGDGARQWGLLAPLVRWRDKADLWNAGWHCSNCFATVDELLRKMESFSHMLLNAPHFRERDRIVDRVRAGKDLWDRDGEVYDWLDDNQDVPAPLRAERDRWSYLLERNGSSGGFVDYP